MCTATSGPLRRFILALVAVAGLGAGSSTAQETATISGRVRIGVPVATRRPMSGYPTRSVPAPKLATESERQNVVVYLRNVQSQATAPVRAALRQVGEAFLPRVIAVTVGSEVEFPNDDPFYHNVFSLSRAKAFNLGRYARGATRRVRFDKPGIVKVFCDLHAHMSATVMVFDHPWFAVPDASGYFELPAVPLAEQQLTAWHERLGDTTVRVHVETGRIATADFVLPVPEQ